LQEGENQQAIFAQTQNEQVVVGFEHVETSNIFLE
jgi:hypothetical protein